MIKEEINMLKKCISIFMFLVLCLSMNVLAFAGDMTGYAIYRDGVAELEWHAGIMWGSSTTSTNKPVVHHPGTNVVKFDTWRNFIDGNIFKGYYESDDSPTLNERARIAGLAKKLANENIPYCFYYQLETDLDTLSSNPKTIKPENITAMRCDGVVEYCYEYYGHRIYGSNSNWDITIAKQDNIAKHSLTNVTPKKQASYMTKVSSDE